MKHSFIKSALAIAISATLPLSVYAAEADNTDENSAEDENVMIVTASKREQDIQDVPMSMMAINGELLEERGDMTFEDYASSIPSLTFQKTGNAGDNQIILRGLGPTMGAGTVSTYVDGAPMNIPGSRSSNPDFTLFDIDRVEVLRGPQGTLYGEGSVGGTISLITNRPDTEYFDAKVQVGYESYEGGSTGLNYNVMLNVPVAEETFGVRVVASIRDNGGYIDEINRGLNHVNTDETDSYRIQALWNLSDDFTATLIYNYQDAAFGSNNRIDSPVVDPNRPYVVSNFQTSKSTTELSQVNLLLEWDLGWATLESITSSSENNGFSYTERDSFLGSPAFGATIPITGDIVSEELRLVSNDENDITWIVGLYYKDSDRAANFDFTEPFNEFDLLLGAYGFPDTRTGIGIAAGTPLEVDVTEKNSLRSVFGEVNWALAENWNMTVGLRYFSEDVKVKFDDTLSPAFGYLVGVFTLLGGGVPDFPVPGTFDLVNTGDINYSGTTWKVVVDYHLDENIMFYGTVSTGFRSGGANPPPTFPSVVGMPAEYAEDTVINYELGLKSQLLDNTLSINAALFMMDWTDMQVDGDPTQILFVGVKNGPDAESTGLELDVTFKPNENLTLSFGGAYINAETSEADIRDFMGAPVTLFEAGELLPNTAKVTGSASATYDFEIFGYESSVRADFSHRGETYGNLPNDPINHVPSYNLVNMSMGLYGEDWTARLFINNVQDDHFSITEFQGVFAALVPPRTIGVNYTYNF